MIGSDIEARERYAWGENGLLLSTRAASTSSVIAKMGATQLSYKDFLRIK